MIAPAHAARPGGAPEHWRDRLFLPISDAPNPPGRPLVTWALIGLNVPVYLLAAAALRGRGGPLAARRVQELHPRMAGRGGLAIPGLTNYDLLRLRVRLQAGARVAPDPLHLHVPPRRPASTSRGTCCSSGSSATTSSTGSGAADTWRAYLGTGAAATLLFAAMSPRIRRPARRGQRRDLRGDGVLLPPLPAERRRTSSSSSSSSSRSSGSRPGSCSGATSS